MNLRAEEVANEVQRVLSELIRTEVRDPRVGYITITRVNITDDLSLAQIYVSEMATSEQKSGGESIVALRNAAGFLRRELRKRMRLRVIPELRFESDRSIEEGLRMTQLLDEIARTDSKRDDDST